ncbi:MAG TPA: hypothetical protein VID27_21205 [Blastocatellia bacterium]|jgi:hypothetical protein
MTTETKARLTPAELIAKLNRLSDERLDALREAGIEPYVEAERSAEDQRRARRAIYEWRKQRLEARKESES